MCPSFTVDSVCGLKVEGEVRNNIMLQTKETIPSVSTVKGSSINSRKRQKVNNLTMYGRPKRDETTKRYVVTPLGSGD